MSTPPNPDHLSHLAKGVDSWNAWRKANPEITQPRLRGVRLNRQILQGINLSGADLYMASLWRAKLDDADLSNADLSSATMNGTSLRDTNLRGANLRFARMVGADVTGAKFSGCHVYGCSIWNLTGRPSEQNEIVITPLHEPQLVTVDDLQIAQFMFLMINNNVIREALILMSSRAVLLLGRFTHERKTVLDTIRNELRQRNPPYIPIVFDFQPLQSQTLTQTVSALAHMVRFIIIDISFPKSVPQEIATIVPRLPMVPVQAILLESEEPWTMFKDLLVYQHVLPVFKYNNLDHLRKSLESGVIAQAEARVSDQYARLREIRETLD
jgi:hypothetical protein